MINSITFHKKALKSLNKIKIQIPSIYFKIVENLKYLEQHKLISLMNVKRYKNCVYRNYYRLRLGDYRIRFFLYPNNVIYVNYIGLK